MGADSKSLGALILTRLDAVLKGLDELKAGLADVKKELESDVDLSDVPDDDDDKKPAGEGKK